MTRRICWDRSLVQTLFTTEADTKLTLESFLLLHQPFDRIRVLAAKPYVFVPRHLFGENDATFVSEEGLLDALSNAPDQAPNRVFVLTGEPGSGKSHLARWIHHQLSQRTDRYPIYFPRRINTLVGVLRQLREQTGRRLPEPSTYLLEAPAEKIVRYLVSYLDMAAGATHVPAKLQPLLTTILKSDRFLQLLAHQIARYQATRSSPGSATLILLSPSDLEDVTGSGTPPERTETLQLLQGMLNDALRKLANLDQFDLKQELAEISASLVGAGQRPVLILEDITSFDLLHDDLLTFLLDESAGHFDALVCWTTGFEKAYLRTYQLDRYAARLTLTDGNAEVYALQNGKHQKLVGRYLDAVKPWCHPEQCELYHRCVPTFAGLYPFNPEALRRIYQNLLGTDHHHRKTPRNLLDRAIKGYLELAEQDGSFPPVKQPAVVKDILYPEVLFRYRETYPGFVALMGWYGTATDGALVLEREVAHLLGVAVPTEFVSGGQIRVPLGPKKESLLPAPQKGVNGAGGAGRIEGEMTSQEYNKEQAPNNPEKMEAAPVGSGDPEVQPAPPPTIDVPATPSTPQQQLDLENRLKELQLEIQDWSVTLRPMAHYQDLTRGVVKLLGLFKLRLPVSFAHPRGHLAGLVYGKNQAESNITLEGTRGKYTPTLQFFLHPRDPIAMGREDEIWRAALSLQLLDRLPPGADIAFLAYWAQERYRAYTSAAQDLLRQQLGLPWREWLLAARWTLLATYSGMTRAVYPWLLGNAHETVRPFPDDLTLPGLDATDITEGLIATDELIEASFHLSRGFIDTTIAQPIVQELNPEEFLPVLAEVSHTRIDPDFRYRGNQRQLRDLVRLVKNVARTLLRAHVEPQTARIREELHGVAKVLGADSALLSEQLQRLRRIIALSERYDLFEPRTWSEWEEHGSTLQAAPEAPDRTESVPVLELQAQVEFWSQQTTGSPWSYFELAAAVSVLRQQPAYLAARSAASIVDHLAKALSRDPTAPVLDLLRAYEAELTQPRMANAGHTVTSALALIREWATTYGKLQDIEPVLAELERLLEEPRKKGLV